MSSDRKVLRQGQVPVAHAVPANLGLQCVHEGRRLFSPSSIAPTSSNQASATRNYPAAIGSEDPVTIRIDSRPAHHLDVANRRRSPMQALTSYKPTSRYQSGEGGGQTPLQERASHLASLKDLLKCCSAF
jgi:hypothetical protein